jgi:PAS domain S-box-containing protein
MNVMAKKVKASTNDSTRNLGSLSLLISDHITAMLAYWDTDLVCRYANSAYVDWFGKTKEQMINKIRIHELLGPLYEKNLPYIKRALLGEKQLFEREIPIPDGGGVRHSLATYIPDIINGKVLGFFVHVADVTYLKDLEKEVAAAKKETLRKIIETQETEKRQLVEVLGESVNQLLVASKMIIERERKKGMNTGLHEDISASISKIILELNLLCQNLAPTEINLLGLIESISQYFAKLARLHHTTIEVVFKDTSIEKLALKDKYSIFRILQNFIKIGLDAPDRTNIEVTIQYTAPHIKIRFVADGKIVLVKSSNEYHAIACRVDYYTGKITELHTASKSIFEIELSIPVLE